MNITNQSVAASKATMQEILQDEIDRCNLLIDVLQNSANPWSPTVAAILTMDITTAEKAIADKHNSAMFRSLRALRLYNLSHAK